MKKFKYGFTIGNLRYGWYEKDLYRLPSVSGGNYYPLKLQKVVVVGNQQGYVLNKKRKSLIQLKSMTAQFTEPIVVNDIVDDNTPF